MLYYKSLHFILKQGISFQVCENHFANCHGKLPAACKATPPNIGILGTAPPNKIYFLPRHLFNIVGVLKKKSVLLLGYQSIWVSR